MLQRLAQFRVALLEFFEQPNVLDRDDGLVGKGFKRRNLFLRERSYFDSANTYAANRDALSQQRHVKYAATTRDLLGNFGLRIFCLDFGGNIVNVNYFPVDHGPASGKTPTQW